MPEPTVEIVDIEDLVPDDQNANLGTQRGLFFLDRSLRQRGAGRSVLIDKDRFIMAGNKTVQAAVDAGRAHLFDGRLRRRSRLIACTARVVAGRGLRAPASPKDAQATPPAARVI